MSKVLDGHKEDNCDLHAMISVVILLCLLVVPFALLAYGHKGSALLLGIYVIPSIVYVFYLSIKNKIWPRIVGGPSIGFGGRRLEL